MMPKDFRQIATASFMIPLWSEPRKANDLIVLIVIEYFWTPGDYVLGPLLYGGRIERGTGDEPRRAWHHLGRRQDTSIDETPGGPHADFEPIGGFDEADHVVDMTSFRNAQALARFADADRCPGLSVDRSTPHAVERDGDVAIVPSNGKFPDRLYGAWRRFRRNTTTTIIPWRAEFAVPTAGPMN